MEDAGVKTVFPLDDSQEFKEAAGFSGEAPVIVESGGQQPDANADGSEDDAEEAPFPRPVELIELTVIEQRGPGSECLERIDELGGIVAPPWGVRVFPFQRSVTEEQQHHHEGHEDGERDDVGLGELRGVLGFHEVPSDQ